MRRGLAVLLGLLIVFGTGCSNSSKPTKVTPPAATIPAAPTGLTATAGDGQVVLSWTGSTGAASYNVYFSTATGVTTSSTNKISALTATTYTQSGLTDGTTYFYIVTAVNSAGESPASSQATATPVPAAPAAPTGLTATAGNAQVVLSFTGSAGSTSYNLYYSTTAGVTPANGTKISAITNPYTQTGLTNGTAYYYVITAVNAGGESPASAQATATPQAPAPSAPSALTATAGDSQIALSWTAGANATSYNLYYGTATGVTPASGIKVAGITGASYTLTNLVNGTAYFFVLTSVNGSGESAASNEATATPTAGITIQLVPGTAASGTLQTNATTSLTFNFASNAVSQNATATISALTQMNLPVPLERGKIAHSGLTSKVVSSDTYVAAFSVGLDPTTITLLNAPVTISGLVGSAFAANSSLTLAMLQNGQYVDIETFVVGTGGAITENLPSVALPGLLGPGTYIVYQAPAGTTTAVSNFGVALIANDGYGMADGSDGVQVVHIYDVNGALLPVPTVSYLDYQGAGDLDGDALTPDGSQGILVDGGNTVRFFSNVQTGTPVASTTTVDISDYGGDGDSVAILPTGDEAVVSGDDPSKLLVVSGIVSGNPVAATTIPVPDYRDGVVVSTDGKALLARGPSGLTVYSIAAVAPSAGSIGGTISHTFTQVLDFPSLGTNGNTEDGRDGMAISPVDSSRAVVLGTDATSSVANVQILTGLTSAPVAGAALVLPSNLFPYSVSVTPDGKNAIVGTSAGLLLYTGVDTGSLVQVGDVYAPAYTLGNSSVTMGGITTLGITLDGKYVMAGDQSNRSLVVVPFTSAGFAPSPASAVGSIAVPDNDQLLVH